MQSLLHALGASRSRDFFNGLLTLTADCVWQSEASLLTDTSEVVCPEELDGRAFFLSQLLPVHAG